MGDARDRVQRMGGSGRRGLSWLLTLAMSIAFWPGSARAESSVAGAWILVDTKMHTLSVFGGDRLLERFDNIAIGRGGFSLDRMRDDGTTPLGTFHIDRINAKSRFRLFFGIDYPRPEHAQRALDAGRIAAEDYQRIVDAFQRRKPPPQDTPLGGQIGIHGLGGGDPRIHEIVNWTQGCIALTNEQIRRLSQWIHVGMRVEVR